MDIPSYLLGKRAGGGKGSLKYVVVDELPAAGEDNTIYLVPKSTSGTNNYYDEYMYIDNNWELIGDTEVDLSSKQDVMQFTTLPTANASNVGKIYQYVGATNANYTNGYFYMCVSDGQATPTYSWEQINVQDGASYTAGTNIEITNAGVINNTIPFQYKNYSYGLGNGVKIQGAGSIAIGSDSWIYPNANGVAVGNMAEVRSTYSVAVGDSANAKYQTSIAIGRTAETTKTNQCMIGGSSGNINELTIYTSNGAKIMATQDYVDSAISTAITSTLGGSY